MIGQTALIFGVFDDTLHPITVPLHLGQTQQRRIGRGVVVKLWPGQYDYIAIDGKTARCTHDRRKGRNPSHTLKSAHASPPPPTIMMRCYVGTFNKRLYMRSSKISS